VHGLEKEYGEQVEFVYYNIDDPTSAEAKIEYNFRFQPHVILVDENGEIIQQWLGYNSPNVYEEAFESLLAN
jgi:DNA-directed RNA polymerase subunit L